MSSIESELVEAWKAAGIERGDTVLVHSNATRLLRRLKKEDRAIGLEEIFFSLHTALGSGIGTSVWPTFNFGFARGQPFVVSKTPSEMGALSEWTRECQVGTRSGHPI